MDYKHGDFNDSCLEYSLEMGSSWSSMSRMLLSNVFRQSRVRAGGADEDVDWTTTGPCTPSPQGSYQYLLIGE